MIDNRKIIIRKAKDGVNYKAVIMDYCGRWYERRSGSGATPREAIKDLIRGMEVEIYMIEEDIALCYCKSFQME